MKETDNKYLPLLLIAWVLIQIGLATQKVLRFGLNVFSVAVNKQSQHLAGIFLPKLSSPAPRVKKQHRRRGRPRSRSIWVYIFGYKLLPFARVINKIFPSRLRVGIALAILIFSFVFYSFYLFEIAHDLPSPDKLSDTSGPLTTTFYDRNGKVLYRLYQDKNRTLVKLTDLPPNLVNATIAIEDKNFYTHPGVDLTSLFRVAYDYAVNHEVTGGSTITQQLIKNTLLTSERTWQRKLREMVLAFWAERIYSKNDILQMYFNEVGYGGTTWGIAAASQTYFNKPPKDLDLAESSYISGLPSSPTTYSPYGDHPEYGKDRQKEVLRRMVEEHFITQDEAVKAYEEKLVINPPIAQIQAPHFVMYVKSLLDDEYGDRYVAQSGLQVYTSLDLDTQNMVQNVVKKQVEDLANLDVTNGAAEVTDPQNGQILAMVGSKDYWDPNGGNFNVATAERQPGSSIKPITYATAFKQGFTPATTILDAPVAFRTPWETYAPVNYDGKFHGPVTIRTSLGSSFNIPAVKTLAMVGIPNMLQTAHDMGITSLNDSDRYGLSLTLGGGEVKLVDMMTVYGTLSQNGTKHDPTPILKVVDPTGKVIEDHTESQGKQVLDPGVAYMLSSILSDNNARTPAFGPNSLLIIPNHTVAVKTGTTDSKRDNWTFGYTPNIAVGVWVGNNDNHPMNPALTSGVTGAAPIWHEIMANLLQNKSDIAFQRPDDVIDTSIDGKKDLAIRGLTTKTAGVTQTSKPNTPNPGNITFTDPFSTYTVQQSQ
jgi:1A family penicillin-binding protein